DIATWLPNDLLIKLDRCLMANGLEGRTPFLDPEVADFAFTLPDRFKVRGRFGKYLLRAWLARHCPAAAPWARKQGFTVPVDAWIAPRAADIVPTWPRSAPCAGSVRRRRSPPPSPRAGRAPGPCSSLASGPSSTSKTPSPRKPWRRVRGGSDPPRRSVGNVPYST
ncbi:MAG: asparagine synthase-related protein, partial [Phenylobacterium sp.]